MDLIAQVFELVNNKSVPIYLALGIFLFAFLVWIVFTTRTYQIRRDIKRAISSVSETPSDESEFYDHYQALNDRLLENKLLGHVWSEYTENLIVSEEHHVIRNSYDANSYFNSQNIISKKINLYFYQAFPNKLVGIGLLFTFIGLVAALYFASKGVNSPDIEIAKEELAKLLNAATFKFTTSIAGLFASLLFSWREKHQLYAVRRLLGRFCELLDERLSFVTPEILANEQLQELIKQSEQLERFNTDLAVSIASAIEQPISNALNREISPLLDAITNMASNIGGMNEDVLRKMMADFGDKLHASAGKEISELGSTLSGLVSSIENASSNLQSGMSGVVEDLGSQVEQLSKTLNDSANQFSSTVANSAQTMDSQMSHTFGGFMDSMSRFNEGVTALSGTTNDLQSLIERIRELIGDFETPIREIKEVGQPLAGLSSTLQQLSMQMSDQKLETEVMINSLNNASEEIRQTSSHVRDTLSSYQENFSKIDDATVKVFEEINRGLDAYTDKIKDFVLSVDENFTKALTSLSSAINDLQDVIEESKET